MYKKILAFIFLTILGFLFFRPRYSGHGQECKCIGYRQNRVDESHLNIVDSKTFKTLIRGTETVTTICYGIPYQCELNTGYEVFDNSLDIK